MSDILDRYLEEASDDASLDVFTVKDVQSKLPGIKHKWVGRLIRAKRKLANLYEQKEDIKNELLHKAKEQAPYKVSDASIEKSLKKTKTIKDIDREIREYKLIVDFLERTEKVFSSMTFDIKNLTEVMKLETM
jgi:hypothetical protein